MNIDIRKYLESEHEPMGVSIREYLPFGWQTVAVPMEYLQNIVTNPTYFRVVSVQIKKGMLYLVCNPTLLSTEHALDIDVFNRIALSITRDSAKLCMVCGKKGFRRKDEYGMPCLCHPHYIEYVNFLAEL